MSGLISSSSHHHSRQWGSLGGEGGSDNELEVRCGVMSNKGGVCCCRFSVYLSLAVPGIHMYYAFNMMIFLGVEIISTTATTST